jgi:hypothetical protein
MPDKKKILKYESEQLDIFNKLFNILNDDGDTFVLYNIEHKMCDDIINLSDNIKKYYPSSSCAGVNTKFCKKPHMSIIRYILKFHHKTLLTVGTIVITTDDNQLIRTKIYTIIPLFKKKLKD